MQEPCCWRRITMHARVRSTSVRFGNRKVMRPLSKKYQSYSLIDSFSWPCKRIHRLHTKELLIAEVAGKRLRILVKSSSVSALVKSPPLLVFVISILFPSPLPRIVVATTTPLSLSLALTLVSSLSRSLLLACIQITSIALLLATDGRLCPINQLQTTK